MTIRLNRPLYRVAFWILVGLLFFVLGTPADGAPTKLHAAPVQTASWVVVHERDQDIVGHYWQCEEPGLPVTAMSENDEWFYIADGTLAPGESLIMQQPRANCYETNAVRAGWRWLGSGRAPVAPILTVIDPVGGAQYRYEATRVVDTKSGKTTWFHYCTQVSTEESFGFYTFVLENLGPKPLPLRFGASIKPPEFASQQCDGPGLGWPSGLSQYGV